MPYDFELIRTENLDNRVAINKNKELAQVLIDTVPEIYDLNAADSDFHFEKIKIDETKEYPERHFQLHATFDKYSFILDFWKDQIYIELGAYHDHDELFNSVRKIAGCIIKHDFLIDDPVDDRLLNLENGIERNLNEYIGWCRMVDKVKKIVNKNE